MEDPTKAPEKELTPAEIAERQARMKEWYNTQLEILRPQAEYEKLLAEIEESRFRRLRATFGQAQMIAGPPEEAPEETPGEESNANNTASDPAGPGEPEQRPTRRLLTDPEE